MKNYILNEDAHKSDIVLDLEKEFGEDVVWGRKQFGPDGQTCRKIFNIYNNRIF